MKKRDNRRRMRVLMLGTAALFAFAPAAVAQTTGAAQEEAGAEAAPAEEQDVVVTGSRVISDGFAAPTPVTVISGEELLTTTPSTIGEALNKLPQFANSVRPSSAQFGPESGASTQLNLRSLEAKRGLILLDSRRLNPSTATGVVDIAILPEELVERVDIVTGGASAAYGSDAVAGVVNFILDTDFEGFKANIQGGVTDVGDNVNGKVSATWGTKIGDRLHLVLSGAFYNAEGVESYRKRDWFQSCAPINTPGVAGGLPATPLRYQVCDANTTLMAPGGLIVGASPGVPTTGPNSVIGTEFLDGGTPAPFQFGTMRSRTMMVGGTQEDQGIDFQPMPELRRITGYGHLTWEASDNFSVFADALVAQSNAKFRGTLMQMYDTTTITIYDDNAFLPEAIRSRIDVTPGADFIRVGTSNPAIGILQNEGISDTQRFTVGFKGEFGGWDVDAYYEHGTNLQTILAHGNLVLAHYFDAIDAVRNPANGQIVCRTQLANPGHKCVPYNVFGPNSASQEAVDFVTHGPGGDGSWTKERTKQDVIEVAARGRPFETWAGPVGVALGAGYRKESVDREVDPGSSGPKISCLQTQPAGCPNAYPIPRGVPSSYLARPLGAYFFSNQQPITGGYDLWEVFGEVAVPLARDTPFLQALDLNAAVRYTDYSLSGGVTTWKVGLSWQPIDDIRFRATRSRDIRAANLTELYSTSAAGAGSINERLPDGSLRTSTVVNLATGNPDLVPEKANTLTVGGVFSPSFIPGFQFSVDYYDIDISEAIGQLGGQNIVDQCTGGATALCGLIERDADGIIFRVNNGYLNISRMKTSGLDFEASYRTSLGEDSTLGIRAIASKVFELSTRIQNAAPVDRAGQTGSSGGVPNWNFNVDVNLKVGGFGLSVNERIIGAGTYNSIYVEGVDIDDNSIPAIAYTDLTATYKFDVGGKEWELYGTINNLLDQAPPREAGQFFVFGTIPSNSYLFDAIGRAYTLGLRIRM